MTSDDWVAVSRRNARSVQTTIGWIFWDPGAVARYEALGLPGPLGYIASRAAPLATLGPQATIAAFGSISPLGIEVVYQLLATPERFLDFWRARDEAVLEGLAAYAPEMLALLATWGPTLWPVVESLPLNGRIFFAAHLAMERPEDPVLSGWHAINCLREWRGDTHWALVVAAGLTHAEASIVHNAWLGYEKDWLAKSRGTSEEDIERGWTSLREKGYAKRDEVLSSGVALRQRIEDDTDALTSLVWQRLGVDASATFATDFEPPCEKLLVRVDVTAGPNYQPASRVHGAA